MSEAWLEGVLISASPIGGLTGNRETPVRATVPVREGHRPGHALRVAPARPDPAGAGLSWCGLHRSWVCAARRRGNALRFRVRPETGQDGQRQHHQARCHGRGHRPCHSATLNPPLPGAQSPRPAPVPPMAGASHPPGRALASVGAGCTGLGGSVAPGAGETQCVSCSRPETAKKVLRPFASARPHGRGHRLCHSATLNPGPSGTGAGLSWCGLRGSCTTVVPYRAGKRAAFPGPPALPTALCRISRIIPAHSHRGCLDLNPVTASADAPAQSGPARGLRTPPRKRQGVCGSTAAR